ncbi:TPA: RdgB/HAM1 family non-canonical purine NTP pyrophosphatase [Clostridium botulinum]|nr:RdgB/HAM1 family non-canonical purine NTP pyrophosphatase [Clostridium botulinum]
MIFVIATNNKNKVKELEKIINIPGVELKTLKSVGVNFDIDETGATLEENSKLKAKEYFKLCSLPVIAEDSGLMIESLDGYPGVYSKRVYEGKTDRQSNEMILDKMRNIKNRTAKYIAVYTYFDGINTIVAEGIIEGSITKEIIGTNGFAYDPIFLSKTYDKTFGELTDEEKNSISHRRDGINKLMENLYNSNILYK